MAQRTFDYTDPTAALWMCKTYRIKLLAGNFCLQPYVTGGTATTGGKTVRH